MESYARYSLKNAILSKKDFSIKIEKLISAYWKFTSPNLSRVSGLLDVIVENVFFYLEMPYVDKVFRDSYYSYFSSKYKVYFRDCIRVSIFNNKIDQGDIVNPKSLEKLQDSFMGYFILRPIETHLLGRSFISPKAFKNNNFLTALTSEKLLIGSHHLVCSGFPHIVQDSESMSCAESTIWMLLEYYSNRYKEYSPVLPSEITQVLSKSSYKRLLPSEGLTIVQISLALKSFGFSTKVYYKNKTESDKQKFFRYLYYYMESGIPVILGLQEENGSGHAIVACGHSRFNINNVKAESVNDRNVLFTSKCFQDIVIMDDNSTPYLSVNYSKPCAHYLHNEYQKFEIQYLSVPLYKRIYLDAKNAEKICYEILTDTDIGLSKNNAKNTYIFRLFLTSSKSFKFRFANNLNASKEMKEYLINTAFPKFIWVCEISNYELYNQNLANGILILDATGSANKSALIFYYKQETMLDIEDNSGNYIFVDKKWVNFNQYQNNLKGEWNNFTDY